MTEDEMDRLSIDDLKMYLWLATRALEDRQRRVAELTQQRDVLVDRLKALSSALGGA